MQAIRRVVKSVVVLAGLLLDAGQTQAAPIFSTGDQVRVTHEYPAMGIVIAGPSDVTVGPGVELSGFNGGTYNIDFSPGNILMTFNLSGTWDNVVFNGPHFFDFTGTLPSISGVTIDPSTNMVGFDASRISFDADNIFVNFQGLPITTSTVVSLNVAAAAIPTPEPASLALWSMGAIGMAIGAARRKRRTPAA